MPPLGRFRGGRILCAPHISADPRQLLAGEHVDHPPAPDGADAGDHSLTRPDGADDRGAGGEREGGEDCERARRGIGRNEGDEPPLIGDIERIEAEQFAGGGDVLADRNRGLHDID